MNDLFFFVGMLQILRTLWLNLFETSADELTLIKLAFDAANGKIVFNIHYSIISKLNLTSLNANINTFLID